jgi:thyroglobulin
MIKKKDTFCSWAFLPSHFPRNPNYPHEFSLKALEFAAPWPDFIPRMGGESYKEFSALLPNRQGLKQADCSFWSKYIQALKAAGS